MRELLPELGFYLGILAIVVGTWSALWWLLIFIAQATGHS
jgi:hypothetical protein